ncbi:hypothetical protein P154DRAFT_579424 [Amniculicola lignicola CBS 123094]|uniref:Uncharacterized protein n=1 Tax=Amniculicola lignicola CBS 123094 TaxID=1392246 RepID=A0A6A5W4Z0_9PLEO|nr:hypothetical protein P154DRAFT_579424 [Amniculicola lignicola CBS 123094]
MESPPTPPPTPENAFSPLPGIEIFAIIWIERLRTSIAIVRELLTSTPLPRSIHRDQEFLFRSNYQNQEFWWPKFKELAGTADALNLEKLFYKLEASRRKIQLWNPEEKIREVLFKPAEEPDILAAAFGGEISKGGAITMEEREHERLTRWMHGRIGSMREGYRRILKASFVSCPTMIGEPDPAIELSDLDQLWERLDGLTAVRRSLYYLTGPSAAVALTLFTPVAYNPKLARLLHTYSPTSFGRRERLIFPTTVISSRYCLLDLAYAR